MKDEFKVNDKVIASYGDMFCIGIIASPPRVNSYRYIIEILYTVRGKRILVEVGSNKYGDMNKDYIPYYTEPRYLDINPLTMELLKIEEE